MMGLTAIPTASEAVTSTMMVVGLTARMDRLEVQRIYYHLSLIPQSRDGMRPLRYLRQIITHIDPAIGKPQAVILTFP
jgi:hypothetical protein